MECMIGSLRRTIHLPPLSRLWVVLRMQPSEVEQLAHAGYLLATCTVGDGWDLEQLSAEPYTLGAQVVDLLDAEHGATLTQIFDASYQVQRAILLKTGATVDEVEADKDFFEAPAAAST